MIEARRARPLLGTRVEVHLVGEAGEDRARLLDAAGAALDEIERVHRLLSFHDPESELSRLHREAPRRAVRVDPRTAAVLRLAVELWRSSGGAFDPAVASRLVAWELLPPPADAPRPSAQASLADLEWGGRERVRFRRPLWLDLGGLAKGFAVDRAVAVLRRRGVASGCVEAGGDLRVFGSRTRRAGVRPEGSEIAALLDLRDTALATSAGWVTERSRRGASVCHLIDPRRGEAIAPHRAASVVARRCALADGLTKICLIDPERAAALLRRWGAQALLFESGERRLLPSPPSWRVRGGA